MRRFKVLDHTADVGLRVYGRDLKELFENAGIGLFSLITDLRKVRCQVEKQIEIWRENPERLMVEWLNELLYFHDVDHLLFKRFSLDRVDEAGLRGKAEGEPFQDRVHVVKTEVKAVTYHQIQVRREDTKWKAQIFFDL